MIYCLGLFLILWGLEVGMVYGYFIVGFWIKFGLLWDFVVVNLGGLIFTIVLVLIVIICLFVYGLVFF